MKEQGWTRSIQTCYRCPAEVPPAWSSADALWEATPNGIAEEHARSQACTPIGRGRFDDLILTPVVPPPAHPAPAASLNLQPDHVLRR
jgi:hypothetical protein